MKISGLLRRWAGSWNLFCRLLQVFAITVVWLGAGAQSLRAETGRDAWLRYDRLDPAASATYSSLPRLILRLGDSPVLVSTELELTRGLRGLLGGEFRAATSVTERPVILVGTLESLKTVLKGSISPPSLTEDGYWLAQTNVNGATGFVITAQNDRGVLYGVFAFLSKIARAESMQSLNEVQVPANTVRMIDQWDNLDGTIERGYAGASLFFEDGRVRQDLSRAAEYARLLASVGINTCAINNVNANPRLLDRAFLPQLRRVAEAFRPWGVRLALSVDVSSPKLIGGLPTFDPLDPRVAAWWQQTVGALYAEIPDFAGFVVKADSEGRAGPASYGRTPADAANVIARALKPHGGLLFYRSFVYDHHLDWRNPKNDRARAAYDIFHPLDGQFADNVVIQIKHGPIDFQVREPVSPLLGGLEKTNEAVELQITQEYTGQQRHLCYLLPMWKEVLDFDMRNAGHSTRVRDLLSGKTYQRPYGGLVGVANVGMDANWLAHPLAMANLYGFGRLAWDPTLSAQTIAEEWTRLTIGNDSTTVTTIDAMLLSSWNMYESYTGPLGAGTLTDILGSHYGPGVESSEQNGWGQWHRADHAGIGMDRTVATGTGYVAQYSPAVAKQYESVETTPDELLLFFHHVPYSYKLHSGKTVIQHIYDSHYEGASRAAALVTQWQSLKRRVDQQLYEDVLRRLEYQAGHAIVWRDAICNWFARTSSLPDERGRVGHYLGRIEAEDMELHGYVPFDVTPWEAASGGKGIECPSESEPCTASFHFTGAPGRYDIDVRYFDQSNGISQFRVYLGNQLIAEWSADDHFPATIPNADSSTRYRIRDITLKTGDALRIEGHPDGPEHAALDYAEFTAANPGSVR
ncbi:MAG: alpha-glucuronidase family glycosyl hydrolase [Candidatus Acidiferrales bacterium]